MVKSLDCPLEEHRHPKSCREPSLLQAISLAFLIRRALAASPSILQATPSASPLCKHASKTDFTNSA
ncbi:hypothetical protein DSM3645_03053 [Blastopirellula marina DSM 3645]|uniref:Uncharacterized protein n=1 Tax=Blastopirellula marina DSM 3645 TaxID=314230 RepID=A3ZVS4_9BACT|nr:hypothetical protein DSM3645_03053 [Blastopirellula marina DSM 3645]